MVRGGDQLLVGARGELLEIESQAMERSEKGRGLGFEYRGE